MSSTLEELLRAFKIGEHQDSVNPKAEDKRAVANAVSNYLDDHPALSASELDSALRAVSKDPERKIDTRGTPSFNSRFYSYTYPTSNHYLADDATFRCTNIKQGIALAYNIDKNWEIRISGEESQEYRPTRTKAKRANWNTTIYFRSEEKLKEYFSTRLKQIGILVQYMFEERGLDKK